jgi:type IV secretory pathway VirB10-like protein
VPIINYLRACPLPEAKEHLAALSKEFPDVVKQANALFPMSSAQTPVGARPDEKKDEKKDDKDSQSTATGKSQADSAETTKTDNKAPATKAPAAGKSPSKTPVKTSAATSAAGTRLSKVDKPAEAPVSTTAVLAGMGIGGVLLAGLFAVIFHTGQRTS